MADNYFKRLLKEALQATRAGVYGQFEHGFNFVPTADAKWKIGPGETLTFSGKLLETDPRDVEISITNDLTGPAGHAFVAQTVNPGSPTIVVGADAQTGQATLDFNIPVEPEPTGATTSFVIDGGPGALDRWETIDGNDVVQFSLSSAIPSTSQARDIIRNDDGDYFLTSFGNIPLGDLQGKIVKLDSSGSLLWRGVPPNNATGPAPLDEVAYDALRDVVAAGVRPAGVGIAEGVTLAGYAAAGPDQGGGGEPAPWQSPTLGPNGPLDSFGLYPILTSLVAYNGFFYAAVWHDGEGAANGVPQVYKVDATDGSIAASFDLGTFPGFFFALNIRLAVDQRNGNVIVAWHGTSDYAGASGFANVLKLDSNLSLLASHNLPESPLEANGLTVDENGLVYVLHNPAQVYCIAEDFASVVWSDQVVSSGRLFDFQHDQEDTLVAAGQLSGAARIWRLDDTNGDVLSTYDPNLPARSADEVYLLPGAQLTVQGLQQINEGIVFTQEHSLNPPGRVPAIAAVKYVGENIVGVYFNSANNEEIDPTTLSAVHSVEGPVPIAASVDAAWEYDTPL